MATTADIEKLLTQQSLQLTPEAKANALANPDIAFLQLQSQQIESGGYRRVGESGSDVEALKNLGLYKGSGIYQGNNQVASLTPGNQITEVRPQSAPVAPAPPSPVPGSSSFMQTLEQIAASYKAAGLTPPTPISSSSETRPGFQSPEQRQAAYSAAGIPMPSADEIKKLDASLNTNQSTEAAKLESANFNVDVRKSSELLSKLALTLEGDKNKPVAPDLVAQFNQKRADLGVGKLEDDLAKSKTDIAKLDADYASTLQEEELRPVSMAQIRRRQGQADIAYQRARRDLVAQQTSIASQLDVKYGTINTLMTLTGKNYDNARQDYEYQFNKNIQMINLFKGIEDSQKLEADRIQDNARADALMMINSLKDRNMGVSGLPSNMKLDIQKAEMAGGLPKGWINFIAATVKDPVISMGGEYTDANGNRVVPVYTKQANGSVGVKTIILPGGTQKTGESSEIEKFQKDVSDWIEKLDNKSSGVKWRTAWDALHAKYPQASTEAIDQGLGLQRRNN